MTIPIATLHKYLRYDSETGQIWWIKRPSSTAKLDRPAGYVKSDGYLEVRIAGERIFTHRIAWALSYGKWPKQQLDHINMIRSDNRIVNLREASVADNNRNRIVQKNNRLGIKGVAFKSEGNCYQARIMVNKKSHYLGRFSTAEEAARAYALAAAEHHGEFARAALQPAPGTEGKR